MSASSWQRSWRIFWGGYLQIYRRLLQELNSLITVLLRADKGLRLGGLS